MTFQNQTYLYHHGILGQKWGKRNGPPYPLDENDHSAAEKKAESSYGKVEKKKKKSSEESDKNLKEKNKAIKSIPNETKNIIRNASNIIDKSIPDSKKKYDISKMSDQELRDQVNRMNMEDQYYRLKSSRDTNVSSGKESVLRVMDIAGDVVSFAGSSVALAISIITLIKLTS